MENQCHGQEDNIKVELKETCREVVDRTLLVPDGIQ